MTQIDQIKAEIERLIMRVDILSAKNSSPERQRDLAIECSVLVRLKNFINSLPKEQKQPLWFDARQILPEDDGSEILCIEEGGPSRISRGKLLTGTTKWAYVKALEDVLFK